MSSPQFALDLVTAERRRDAGIKRVTDHNLTFMESARQVARELLQQQDTITADDVRAVCAKRDITPKHYNAWGALFACDDFVHTGEFRKSANIKGRGNLIRVWRAKCG